MRKTLLGYVLLTLMLLAVAGLMRVAPIPSAVAQQSVVPLPPNEFKVIYAPSGELLEMHLNKNATEGWWVIAVTSNKDSFTAVLGKRK